jgi:CheY-like chemotaxis protein
MNPHRHPVPRNDRDPMPDVNQQLRVLVIDDSVDNAELLCSLLDVMGCRTAVAFSGAQGLVTALRFNPHLAFIDLEMPQMGGCEVARRWRADDPQHAVRLICLTGRGQADDRRNCLGAGFDDFFTKPLAAESLAGILATSSAAL